MISAFYENCRLLNEAFGIVPLLYGSLGLGYRAGADLGADDIDILLPKEFVGERWAEFCALLEKNGYALIDEHEHEFEKNGVKYAYARIEGLDSFAGVAPGDIGQMETENCRFLLLNLEQYLRVYTASAHDGYRLEVRGKKDADKIRFIKDRLAAKGGR